MQRRSAKRDTPRKKYTVDAFEGIEELQEVRSDNEPSEIDFDAADSAEEFAVDATLSQSSSSSDSMSEVDDAASDELELASDAGDKFLDEAISIADSDIETTAHVSSKERKRGKRLYAPLGVPAPPPGPKTYTRALTEGMHSSSHDQKRRLVYGSGVEDATPAYEARAKWNDDPPLPGRLPDEKGLGGMRESFYVNKEVTERREEEESTVWRANGGLEGCFERQHFEAISEEEGGSYLPEADGTMVSFLMGPYNAQHLYRLSAGASMPLIQAWDNGTRGSTSPTKQPSSYKSGFLINVGAKVHCLDWVPHEHGQHQYLAVSVLPERELPHPPFEAPEAPAFTPQPPQKASIQIWQLKRREDGTIDIDAGCKLIAVLCTAWGDVKDLKFCPVRTEKSDQSEQGLDLGLLAGLWGDGAIRVLRLNDIPQSGSTSYIRISEAAFSSRPPNTVCTCITWVNSTRIAAGCANGFLAVWNIPTAAISAAPNPRATIYTNITSTYILSITSCYPSRPDFLLSVSMAGYTILTNLSRHGQSVGSPANTVYSNRVRISQRGIAWHDYLQIAVHPEDNNMVRGSPLRRIFASTGLARVKGTVTSLALSPCHPFMLVGSASGEITAVNPIPRVLQNRPTSWQQTWFAHEWRRASAEEVARGENSRGPGGMEEAQEQTNDDDAGAPVSIGSNGLSRILEGLKIERNTLAKEENGTYITQKGMLSLTIYEEKSSVSALAWNPNIEVGGWAAAGMGDGLLRIEDIAT